MAKAHTQDRLQAAIHYVCDRFQEPSKLGATKLNKVLWYADTIAYRLHGKSITGETYIKRQFGPVPAHVVQAIDHLKDKGVLHVREVTLFGKPKREFIALVPAKSDVFKDDERDIIDKVTDLICDHHTATSISDLTHDSIWEAAEIGEEIPMFAVLAATPGVITPEDQKWATAIVKQITA